MAGNLDTSPLAPDDTLGAEDEGAALDAAHPFAVHVLHLDHLELGAHLLFAVGEQIERTAEFRLEAFMRFEAVARDAVDAAAQFPELRVQIAKLDALGGATRGVVFGIEIQ